MNLDRCIHAPARLAIVIRLMGVDRADATWLRDQTGLSWGNLAAHARKLEEAGYLRVHKEFVERRPRTLFELSPAGKAAFRRYRKQILDILR